MIFWFIAVMIGLPTIAMLTDGDIRGGLIGFAILFILFIMHLGCLRGLHAWNNRENYWAYGRTDWMRRKVRRRQIKIKLPEQEEYEDENPWIDCPACRVRMNTVNLRFGMEDGSEVSIFRCPRCLKRVVMRN